MPVLAGAALAAPLFQQIGGTLVMSSGNVRLEYNLGAGTTDFYGGIGFNTGYVKGISYTAWSHALPGTNQAVITAPGNGLPVINQYLKSAKQEVNFPSFALASLFRQEWQSSGRKSRQ